MWGGPATETFFFRVHRRKVDVVYMKKSIHHVLGYGFVESLCMCDDAATLSCGVFPCQLSEKCVPLMSRHNP